MVTGEELSSVSEDFLFFFLIFPPLKTTEAEILENKNCQRYLK